MNEAAPSSPRPVPDPPRDGAAQIAGRVLAVLAAAALLGWSYRGAEIRLLDLAQYGGNMVKYLEGFLHPSFAEWRDYLEQMIVTVHIAIWATFLAVVFAVPLSLAASSNVAPVWVRQPVRRVMDAFRAINEMVFAMMFISAVGLGPFAGMLALFVHTLGVLTKLFSEAVEAADPRPVEGIRATGAGVLDEIRFGIIPQVMPLWASYALYRFESNVRSASVVGIVGAGGIGMVLWDAIRSFRYDETSAILLIVVITVVLLDLVSARIRARFI
jgi:phosphonate transport system permease protein